MMKNRAALRLVQGFCTVVKGRPCLRQMAYRWCPSSRMTAPEHQGIAGALVPPDVPLKLSEFVGGRLTNELAELWVNPNSCGWHHARSRSLTISSSDRSALETKR